MSRGAALSLAALASLVAYLYWPLLGCLDRCVIDPVAVHGDGLGHIEMPDVYLNAWILSWVQHALWNHPLGVFDTNAFYPALGTLTQSEHLFGIAVWALPFRLFSTEAVWLHQVALIGSSLALGLSTLGLVRWLTGSTWSAFLAGAIAILMPWRFSELAHVQLMNVQWFPLVWWMMGRLAEEPGRRGSAIVLAATLTLQLLSSFYLAYFLFLSCAALAAGLAWRRRPAAAAWKSMGLAALPGALLLVLVSLPYLGWQRAQGFQAVAPLFDSVPPGDVFSLVFGALSFGLPTYPQPITYGVPLAVSALTLAALWTFARRGAPPRSAAFAVGLAGAAIIAYVLAHGRSWTIGNIEVPLPGAALATLLPGYEQIRNPLRFAIVIGTVTPVLAGMGCAALLSRARVPSHRLVATGLGIAVALSMLPPPLPARDAWGDFAEREPIYRKLADRPRGPLLEIPWPLQPEHDVIHASHALLGSTLHWQPLLNGYSGYHPRTYPLLRQVAHALPAPSGFERLRDLVDLRYVLVHDDHVPPDVRAAWSDAATAGSIRLLTRSGGSRLFEVPNWTPGAPHLEALRQLRPGRTTLAGHPRDRLAPDEPSGALHLSVPGRFEVAGNRRLPQTVTVSITNDGAATWPGLDPDPEGLVRLRYRFVAPDGSQVQLASSALAADVPPGAGTFSVPITPPNRGGRFQLFAELVQRRDGREHPLGIHAPGVPVEVRRFP